MPLTRVNCETSATSRCKAALTGAGLSTASAGTNTDLNESIASSLEFFGVEPSNRDLVADADIAQLDDSLCPQYLDLLEIRVLEVCHQSILLRGYSKSTQDFRLDRKQIATDLMAYIESKKEEYRRRWNAPAGPEFADLPRGVRHELHLPRGRRVRSLWETNDPTSLL